MHNTETRLAVKYYITLIVKSVICNLLNSFIFQFFISVRIDITDCYITTITIRNNCYLPLCYNIKITISNL